MILLDTSGLLAALDASQRKHAPCRAALEAGDWEVDQPLQTPLEEPLPCNGAEQAAVALHTICRSCLE